MKCLKFIPSGLKSSVFELQKRESTQNVHLFKLNKIDFYDR